VKIAPCLEFLCKALKECLYTTLVVSPDTSAPTSSISSAIKTYPQSYGPSASLVLIEETLMPLNLQLKEISR
jgi:hypothetical protein